MADIKTPEERSRNMSAIRSKDTRPEIYFRKGLFARGYRYRIASSSVPGHPDLYLAKYNLAVFINGCFWHRHSGCKYSYTPKTRTAFWQNKFESNITRDQKVYSELKEKRIRCLIVWECAIRQAKKKKWSEDSLFDKAVDFIESDEMFGEISSEDILPLT